MKNIFETAIKNEESRIDSDKSRLEITNAAQMELIEIAGGADIAGTWIDANGARFREVINDPKNNFIERLANENTREEALAEINKKLYH